jgi:hypothetical protein
LPTEKLFVNAPKETVIKFLLEKFGCNFFTLDDFETDNLGTFSGEIRRQTIHLRHYGQCDQEHIQIAPSYCKRRFFGGHPSLLFADADDELLMFKDYKTI